MFLVSGPDMVIAASREGVVGSYPMLALPAAPGLFHKAIIQSGAHLYFEGAQQATERAAALMAALDIESVDIEGLQQSPMEDVLKAMSQVSERFWPVKDDRSLPLHPFGSTGTQFDYGIPILIGTNRDELALFSGRDTRYRVLTYEELVERVRPTLGVRVENIIAVYQRSRPEATTWDIYIAIEGESHRRRNCIGRRQTDAR